MAAFGNRLLDALPEDSGRLLSDHLERVSLGNKDLIYDVNGPLRHVYYPINGIISLVSIMENGEIIEFGTVGAQLSGQMCEITTFRADRYDRVSRNPEVVYGDTLAEDLRRRDFTMNAMAFSITGDET